MRDRGVIEFVSRGILGSVHAELLPPKLLLSSSQLPVNLEKTKDGTFMLEARVPGQLLPGGPISLTIETVRTMRPLDLGINDDERALGLAVNWIEFEPA